MIIVDAHLDLAMNATRMDRDLLQSVYTIRSLEKEMAGKGRAMGTVAFPELRRGRVAFCFSTIAAGSRGRLFFDPDFRHHTLPHARAWGQLGYYRALVKLGALRLIADAAALDAHIAEWLAWEEGGANADDTPPIGGMLSMEGADPIDDPDSLEEWWNLGLRAIGPTHYGPGRYAGGTGTEFGLTEIGVRLVREMERLGIILDVTHFSDAAFWQALEEYGKPVLASHNSCRALVPQQRAFSDEQLRAISERGGVIGVPFDDWMLKEGWIQGSSPAMDVSLQDVVDHIDHICQATGSSAHAGIGSDLDGGYGREQSPYDLDTIADLQKLQPLLQERGYTPEDIAAILHGNWLRFLGGTLPKDGS